MPTQHPLPLDDADALAAALIREAAAFRARHAAVPDAGRARSYRSERSQRLGRAYLDALHALLAPPGKAKGAR